VSTTSRSSGPLTELRVPGLKFPEGPRWRDGRWWLSDQLGGRVLRVDEHGEVDVVYETEAPSGLGFLPDGALLVARMHDPSLVRVDGTTAEEVCDLRQMARHLNDMYVGPDGRAYVDAYDDHFDSTSHRVVMVAPDRDPVVVADSLAFPNGIAATPDGTTLLVSETFAGHIVAFDVRADGTLAGRRVWAPLPEGTHPDGLCLDEAGNVWVASYLNGEFLHVREGGDVLQRLVYENRWAMSCSLGGDDGRRLLLCTAETNQDDYFAGCAVGHLDMVRVDVAGVQRP
jgi:sugar lactone lactonase YvrE